MLGNDNTDSNTENEEDEEDFSTLRHECLAIVLKTSTRVSGICIWRKRMDSDDSESSQNWL